MKKRALAFLLLLAALDLHAACKPFTGGGGYARYLPTTAKALTASPTAGVVLPPSAIGAIIAVNTQPIRFRTDGTNPTATEGVLLPAGTVLIFTPETIRQLRTFVFIETAGGAEVTVSYCHE